MAGLDLATELLAEREVHERELADEASFRRSLKERSDRILQLVHAEIEERSGVSPSATGTILEED